MIDIQTIRKKLNELRLEEGLIGGSLEIKTLEQEDKNIEAQISFKNFIIEFIINPNLDEEWNKDENIKKYAEAKNIDDVVSEVCKKIVLHELWHWKKEEIIGLIGCPTDHLHLVKNTDAAYKALESKGFFVGIEDQQKRCEYAHEFSNMFEDLVVNSNLSHQEIFDGLAIAYYDMGRKEKKYSDVGEAFIKIQIETFGSQEDRELISLFYTGDKDKEKEINTVVRKTLEAMKIKGVSLEDVISKFRDMNAWEKLCYDFTYNICDLYDKSKEAPQGMSLTKPNPEENQRDKNKSMGGSSNDSSEKDKPKKSYGIINSLDKDLSEKEIEKVLASYHAEKADPPSFMDKEDILKLTYKNLAQTVEIKAKSELEGHKMPLSPITTEPFDVEEHDLRTIDFTRPIVDFESPFGEGINFEVPDQHYTVIAPHTRQNERLPDIMWLIDCSGSMNDGEGKPIFNYEDVWREDSKYHYALLGVFGSVKWLKSQSIAPYIKYNVILFSNTTRASGWHGYHELEESLQVCWNPEFGGTYIDMKTLSPELDIDPSVVIFMSDGHISNWGSLKSNLRRKLEKHYVSFIEIKGQTQASKDIKSWGHETYQVGTTQDLQGMVIDLTKKSYKNILGL